MSWTDTAGQGDKGGLRPAWFRSTSVFLGQDREKFPLLRPYRNVIAVTAGLSPTACSSSPAGHREGQG